MCWRTGSRRIVGAPPPRALSSAPPSSAQASAIADRFGLFADAGQGLLEQGQT
jgi:hypothetical protein